MPNGVEFDVQRNIDDELPRPKKSSILDLLVHLGIAKKTKDAGIFLAICAGLFLAYGIFHMISSVDDEFVPTSVQASDVVAE